MARKIFALIAASCALAAFPLFSAKVEVLHDDGGWCWFEDERAIVVNGKLLFGVVASGRAGNIEAVTYDLKTRAKHVTVLHRPEPSSAKRWLDDHNSPAFALMADQRVLAMYSLHGVDEKIYYRLSEPGDPSSWGGEQIFVPSPTSKVTYSNLFYLPAEGKVYDFFRGLHNTFKPSYAFSTDNGQTWTAGNVFIDVPAKFRHRPYVKYASNGKDMVHVAYTDGHPRDFDNSIYHVRYRAGMLETSTGKRIRELKQGLRQPGEGTLVYQGDANHVAWISDIQLGLNGHPALVFSVQMDSAGLPSPQAGLDHRYHYARFDGAKWKEYEIARAGSKLYQGEDDYTGNIALDPQDLNTVYISTNVDPVSGDALISKADRNRHWELYRGRTKDRGAHWEWTALTRNSTADNLRPIVPIAPGRSIVLWLRGKMTTYTNFRYEVVGLF